MVRKILIMLATTWASAVYAQPPNTKVTVLNGECASNSHISEGDIGEDLSQRRSRYFCDSAVVSINMTNGNVMIQFSERRSNRQDPIAFAGGLDEPKILTVERVYLTPGRQSIPTDGYCKLFYRSGTRARGISDVESIVCGAQIDEGTRRTVPVIQFSVK